MTIPFSAIKARVAEGYVLPLCERWLPRGKQKGNWWVAPVPWRKDNNPSLIVHLGSGNWEDKSLGDKGDIFDLRMRIAHETNIEAAKAIAEYVGFNLEGN